MIDNCIRFFVENFVAKNLAFLSIVPNFLPFKNIFPKKFSLFEEKLRINELTNQQITKNNQFKGVCRKSFFKE